MDPVRFGVIGVGGMGGNHARSFAKVEEATLVAVADVNAETTAKVAQETGAKGFASAEELIEKGDVEAILIATPHFFHPPVAMHAAAHGVHVLSEKPIAVTVAAADAMVEAADQAGTLLGVVFQQRIEDKRAKMKQMVDDGLLGELHRISVVAPWYRPQAYYNLGAWRGTWKGEGGGILMNQAPHSMDQFIWLMGETPRNVQAMAQTRLHEIEVENTAMALVDFGPGKSGYFYASTADIPGGERVELAGDKGLLTLDQNGLRFYELEMPLSQHIATAPGGFDQPKGSWRDVEIDVPNGNHTDVVRAFCRAVRANDDSLMTATGRDGIKALELANAILMAGYTHREVQFPIDRNAVDAMLKSLQEGVTPEQLKIG